MRRLTVRTRAPARAPVASTRRPARYSGPASRKISAIIAGHHAHGASRCVPPLRKVSGGMTPRHGYEPSGAARRLGARRFALAFSGRGKRNGALSPFSGPIGNFVIRFLSTPPSATPGARSPHDQAIIEVANSECGGVGPVWPNGPMNPPSIGGRRRNAKAGRTRCRIHRPPGHKDSSCRRPSTAGRRPELSTAESARRAEDEFSLVPGLSLSGCSAACQLLRAGSPLRGKGAAGDTGTEGGQPISRREQRCRRRGSNRLPAGARPDGSIAGASSR